MPSEKYKANQGMDALVMTDEESGEMELDLVELLYRLLEKIKWIILAAVLGMVLSFCVTKFLITPKYEATSKLYVLESNNQVVDLSALSMSAQLTSDYVQVFKNWHVHNMVLTSLPHLTYDYEELEDMLTITTPSDTRIIEITVTSPDPQEAYDIAMAYATYAPDFIEAKMDTSRPNLFEAARVPEKPSSPHLLINLVVGTALGAFVAIVVIFVQFIADDRIRTAEMLQKRLGLATLGMMPVQESAANTVKRHGGKVKKGAKE